MIYAQGFKAFLLFVIFHCGLPLHLEYSPSNVYTYSYTTEVTFVEPGRTPKSSSKDVGFKMDMETTLTPIWNTHNTMLIQLEIPSAKLSSASRSKQETKLDSLIKYPLLFEWTGASIPRIFVSAHDPSWSANVKVGIASLLQLQRDDGDREERDVSGLCDVTYKVDGNTIVKTKTACENPNTGFTNSNEMLGVTLNSSVKSTYTIKDDIIQSVTSTDSHVSYVNVLSHLTAAVYNTQTLKLKEVSKGPAKIQASSLLEAMEVVNAREKLQLSPSELSTVPEKDQCTGDSCDSVAKRLVRQYRESGALKNDMVGTSEAADAYLNLLNAFRQTSESTLTKVMQSSRNLEMLPQLVDVMSAVQTPSSQSVLMNVLDFQAFNIDLAERYLLAVAFASHPNEQLIKDLMALHEKGVKDSRLQESIINTLGAVTYTFNKMQSEENKQNEMVKSVEKLLLDGLQKCTDAPCQILFLSGLTNAGLPATIPTLVTYTEVGTDPNVHEAAIKSLRRMDVKLITPQIKRDLMDIYRQIKRGYSSTVRTKALKLLLEAGPSEEEVALFLQEATDPYLKELDTYILAALSTAAEYDEDIRLKLKKVSSNTEFGNYHVWAPNGKSISFKSYLAELPDVKGTYDMYVENGPSGIMKRSGMDVFVKQDNLKMQLYSFSTYAAGLEALVGEEVEPGQEDVQATAGLALNIMDISLRPVKFFEGQSGLMSAVWNAPSVLTPALQTNILLHDLGSHIALQNGLVVSHDVKSTISLDLSGSISVSLWNKNAVSLIKNSAAVRVTGELGIQGAPVKAGIQYKGETHSVFDFNTDVDFYEEVKLCLQLSSQPSFFRNTVNRYESMEGLPNYVKRAVRTTQINAASYPLPKLNNILCRSMMVK